MAGADGHALDPVTASGERALRRAEFFAVVRGLLAAAGAGAVGGDTRPEDEPVRFRAVSGLRHRDGEIAALDRTAADAPVTVDVAFMGLTGASGVMPDLYSDRLMEERRARNNATAHFLDLFNHRSISHFYRAWAKYRLAVRFGEAAAQRELDDFSRALSALSGFARDDGSGRHLAMAGPLSRRVRSAGALRRIVEALFGLPVAVIELRPRWVRIAAAEQTRLSASAGSEGRFAQLGVNAVAGASSLDLAGSFRLRIGPLDRATFQSFFGQAGVRERLIETVRMAVGAQATFDIQLVLRRDEVSGARLGGDTLPAALGRNSWILAGVADRDRDDPILPGRREQASFG